MKILICNTTDIRGGAGRASYRLLLGLNNSNIDVKELVLLKESKNKLVFRPSDVLAKGNFIEVLFKTLIQKVKDYRRTRKWNKYPNRKRKVYSDIYISNLNDCLSKIDFDILHLHWVDGDFVNFEDLKHINKPIVWTMHGCSPFTGLCHYFEFCDNYKNECGNCPLLLSNDDNDLSAQIHQLKQKRYKPLDLHIVSPSNWIGKKAKESSLLGNRPIHTIPNGIDTTKFSKIDKKVAREALKLNTNKKTVLFGAVSALEDERKGFEYLNVALQHLQEKYNDDELELLIFGSSAPDNNEKPFFSTTYLDYISNDRLLVLAYSAADVVVSPSKHENLSNAIMESLACGTPVTAFNIGGNSDMIDHKNNGYLAEPYETLDLANGISWCLENNTTNILSVNARQKVTDNFSIEKISQKHISLYKSLLK